MLSARLPYDYAHDTQVMNEITSRLIPPQSHISSHATSDELWYLCQRCWEYSAVRWNISQLLTVCHSYLRILNANIDDFRFAQVLQTDCLDCLSMQRSNQAQASMRRTADSDVLDVHCLSASKRSRNQHCKAKAQGDCFTGPADDAAGMSASFAASRALSEHCS